MYNIEDNHILNFQLAYLLGKFEYFSLKVFAFQAYLQSFILRSQETCQIFNVTNYGQRSYLLCLWLDDK
jgi:hypothetical protein